MKLSEIIICSTLCITMICAVFVAIIVAVLKGHRSANERIIGEIRRESSLPIPV